MNKELETAILHAGRDLVFALARARGWSYENSPPEYVWWDLVGEVNSAGMVP